VLWDVDPRDWEEPGAGVVAERVVSRSRGGSIVVMHTSRSAAGGLAEMVRRLRAKGLEPVALDEMPGLSPVRRG
jgi:peptidoglycan/xylan/chitin deacetylase (PgdA/CDA1 family)